MKSLISAEEATRLIEAKLAKLPAVSCPLDKCLGRILQESIYSDRPFPPFDRSMMDGYAIRASGIDEAGRFTIVADCPAGHPQLSLGDNIRNCIEIMTGAILPSDADCVVPYEATRRLDETTIELLDPSDHAKGDCIHKLGTDRAEGEIILQTGIRLSSRHLTVAASAGYSDLKVSKRPSIAIVSTGDELIEIDAKPKEHQIRRTNDRSIQAALLHAGYPSNETAHIPDNPDICTKELKRIIDQNDIILISGGISKGKKDYIPDILSELGMNCHIHGVAQKPGKPMAFWTNGASAVFGLPGNPISTLTCLHRYVIPSLELASGQSERPLAPAVALSQDVKARDDLTVFLPVKRESGNQATPMPVNNSGDLVRILDSDGYIELPPTDQKKYPAGKSFDFYTWY